MELPKTNLNQNSSTATATTNNNNIVSSDWDIDFTLEELQSIDAIFQSVTSTSSSSSKKQPVADCDEDRPKTRRRLPDSLFNFNQQSTFSSPLLPCPRNRFSNTFRSCYTATSKMRYPAMTFKGHIVYSRTFLEVEKAADELLRFVETKNSDGSRAAIGFDIEWRPSFKKGVGQSKAAVLQLCADAARCHVMHIIHSGFPQNLKSLLEDSKISKVGVGIAGDARKVFKDHNVSVDALEDLSRLANKKLGGEPKIWGLSSLTEKLTSKQVLKPSKIRLGNWEANPLSVEQLKYAATDAFVSWHLFEVLNRLPDPDTHTDKVAEDVAPASVS